MIIEECRLGKPPRCLTSNALCQCGDRRNSARCGAGDRAGVAFSGRTRRMHAASMDPPRLHGGRLRPRRWMPNHLASPLLRQIRPVVSWMLLHPADGKFRSEWRRKNHLLRRTQAIKPSIIRIRGRKILFFPVVRNPPGVSPVWRRCIVKEVIPRPGGLIRHTDPLGTHRPPAAGSFRREAAHP